MKDKSITIPGVPDKLRICRGCSALTTGDCEHCAHIDSLDHARRMGEFYARLRRIDAGVVRLRRCPDWLLHLRAWVRLATIVAFEWLLLAIAVLAFEVAGRAALNELHHF
jgi:hypothetical protein